MTYIIPSKKISISRGKPKLAVNIGFKSDKFKTGWVINGYNQLYNVIGSIYLDMFYVDLDDAVIVNGVILSNMIFVELYGKPILVSENSKKFPLSNVKPFSDFYDTIKVGDIFKREGNNDTFTIVSKNSYSVDQNNRIPFYSKLNHIPLLVRYDGSQQYNSSAYTTLTTFDGIKEFPVIYVRNRELNSTDENLLRTYINESNIKTVIHKSKTLKDHAEFLKTFDKSEFTYFKESNIDINIMYGKVDKKKVDVMYPLYLKEKPKYYGGSVLYFDGTSVKYSNMSQTNSFGNSIAYFTDIIQETKSELRNYYLGSLVNNSLIDDNDQVSKNYNPYDYCLVHRDDKIAVIHKSEFDKIKSIEMEVSEVIINGGSKIKCFTDTYKKRNNNGI